MSFLFNVDQNTLSRQSRPSFERYPRIELDLNRMSSGNNTYSIALNLSGAIIFILTIVSQFSCTVLFLDLYFDIQYQCLSVLCELFYRAPGRVSAQRTFRHNFRQPLAASLIFGIQIDMIIFHDISKNQTPFGSIRYHFAIFTGNFGISGRQSRDCTSHDHFIPKLTSPFDSPWSIYPIQL